MTYVVKVERRRVGKPAVDEYLYALDWDPYQMGGGRFTSGDPEDAFVFRTLAAAEMAAVSVGGTVVEVEP